MAEPKKETPNHPMLSATVLKDLLRQAAGRFVKGVGNGNRVWRLGRR